MVNPPAYAAGFPQFLREAHQYSKRRKRKSVEHGGKMFQDKRGYWYRSSRANGHVIREYLGRNAECARERLGDLDRKGDIKITPCACQQRAELIAIDRCVQHACQVLIAVSQAHMESQGYWQHARGQWRKRRTPKRREGGSMDLKATSKSIAKTSTSLTVADRSNLMQRACAGDRNAARDFFDSANSPEAQMELVDVIADYGQRAREQMLSFCAEKPGAFTIEATDRKLQAMREELCGVSPSPSERLLIERILSCWLQLHQIERAMHSQENFRHVEFLDKCLERAHKRYLASIKVLAQVRKLQIPDVQVNIGENQINIASTTDATS